MGESRTTGPSSEPDEAEAARVSAEPAEEPKPGGATPAASADATPDIKWQGGPEK